MLRPYDLHFGYRIFDEIISYLVSAEQNGFYERLGGQETAFDAAVLMKILPKFHGSRSKLETPLQAVLSWCIDPDSPDLDEIESCVTQAGNSNEIVQELGQINYLLPKTAERIRRMLWAIYTTGFAAFG